jgi:hypothetical protein
MGNIGSHVDLTSGQGRHQVNQPEHPKLGNKNRQLPHPASEVELAARDLVVVTGFIDRLSAPKPCGATQYRPWVGAQLLVPPTVAHPQYNRIIYPSA